ncbi:MAG: aldo/keto reductase [Acidimicrobiales bacterium]
MDTIAMKNLGNSGLKVSELCLGTMTFGVQADEATSHAILNEAIAHGVTFIDTADVYPLGGGLELAGRTEEIIGTWLPAHRSEVVLATKCVGAMGSSMNARGASRKHIIEAVEASLRRLQTDYIDLYQLHSYDTTTPIEETLHALDYLVNSGKVRYVGCSNFKAWQLARALGRSDLHGLIRFTSVQPRYNLVFREIERELLPLCEVEEIGVIPYNPIAGGLLSGKHDFTKGPASGTRFNVSPASTLYRDRYWNERVFSTASELAQVAKEIGTSLVTMAVAWVRQQPSVTSPIIGASKVEQLHDSLLGGTFVLDDETMLRLDELTRSYRQGDADR